MIPFFRSSIPPVSSIIVPKTFLPKHIANALIEKSLRFKSSVSVPGSTLGNVPDFLYVSLRAVTKSTFGLSGLEGVTVAVPNCE